MKKRIESVISRHGIVLRIVIAFLVFLIIPFIIMAGLMVHIFSDYSFSTLGNTSQDAMNSVGFQISQEINNRKEESLFVYYNGIVERLSAEEITAEDQAAIEESLTGSVHSLENIVAACIVDREGHVYGTGVYYRMYTLMESYREEISMAKGKCLWYVADEFLGKTDENRYVLARRLNDTKGEEVGVLYMLMNDSMIRKAFDQLNSEYSIRYLIAEDGTVLYSSDQNLIGSILEVPELDSSGAYRRITMDKVGEVILAGRRIRETNWQCISISNAALIRQSTWKVLSPVAALAVLYIAFLGLVLYLLQHYVFHPIGLLKKNMDQYAQGDLQAVQISPVGVGELRSLSRHFNNMTARTESLLHQYTEEVEEKNRQKLMVLSAQLTPHFIYNALNTIKWMAVLNHQENIQKLTESLIHIFMNATKVNEKNYCVEDELTLIENYAVIQKARFMNFELIIDAQKEAKGLLIRKLILQPIVENAIVHGLERGKIRNSEIRVRVWMDEDLHIEVSDRGSGFDVEEWRRRPVKKEGHTNIGIRSVEDIIRLEYGDPYGIMIHSVVGEGTTVTYRLPVIKKEDRE